MPIPCSVTYLDGCDDLSTWTQSIGTGCTVTENTDPAYLISPKAKSFRFTLAIDGAASNRIDLTKNIAYQWIPDDRIGLFMYVPNKPASHDQSLFVYGSDQVAFGSGGVGRWQRSYGSSSGIGTENQGWQIVPIQFGDTSVTSGAPTRNLSYLSMRLQCTASASYAKEFYIAGIVRWDARPTVIVQFDDGMVSQYTEAFSYMQPLGIPGTVFLIDDLIELETTVSPGFLKASQVREMVNAGWTAGTHGAVTNSWEYSPSTQIKLDTEKLRQRFGYPFEHGAYPNGAYGQLSGVYQPTQDALRVAGIKSCRTVNTHVLHPACYSPYTLPATLNLQSGLTPAQAIAGIDRTIKLRTTCIIIAHKIDPSADGSSQYSRANFRQVIDHVAMRRRQGLLDALSWHDWWNGTRARAAA